MNSRDQRIALRARGRRRLSATTIALAVTGVAGSAGLALAAEHSARATSTASTSSNAVAATTSGTTSGTTTSGSTSANTSSTTPTSTSNNAVATTSGS